MRWTIETTVERPVGEVYRAIANEHELMAWSAWPEATGYSCAVHGDGTSTGSEIRFTDPRGGHRGRQRLAVAEPPRYVRYELDNPGPFGMTLRPVLEFRLFPTTADATRVVLEFTNPVPAPFDVLGRLTGFMRKIHALHVEDLRLLKQHAERAPT